MTPKPDHSIPKGSNLRPARKILKGTAETGRLFVNVDEVIRRTQTLALTRYIE